MFLILIRHPTEPLQNSHAHLSRFYEPTSNGFAKWSTPLSPHLSLQQLEGWETRQHRSTNAWPRCCRRSGRRPIAPHCAGCDAGWPSLYCAVRFKLSEAPGPPARSSRGHAARLPNAVDLVTSESRISGDP